MESPMLKMLKSKYPDRDYPSKLGQRWTDQEEKILLEELHKNIDMQLIAQSHHRTIGGINARRREIAYKLYINNNPMEEIMSKTKLDKDQIAETIKKKQNDPKSYKISIDNEIDEIKKDIKEIKNIIRELVEIMKAVYEFEDTN